MIAFLTGSQRYGTPTPDSDVDLVIRADPVEIAALMMLCDNQPEPLPTKQYPEGVSDSASLRFGRLNLIACANDETFHAWEGATNICVDMKPLTREVAVDIHKKVFLAYGVCGYSKETK